MIKRILFCASALVAIGCSETAMESTGNEPMLSVVAVSGSNDQTAYAGYPAPAPLRALVLSDGIPKSGVSVSWSVNSGTVSPSVSISDSLGIATARWTLGSEPGAYLAYAAADAPGHPSANFRATAKGIVVMESISETNFQTGQVASNLARKLQVRFVRNGTPRAGIAVQWSAVSGNITPESITDATGVAEATWRMTTLAGLHEARATVGGDGTEAVFYARATAAPASKLEVASGTAQSAPLNWQAFDTPLTVIARDEYGNPVQGVVVSWRVQSGPVVVGKAATSTTDVNGRCVVVVAPFGAPGSATVRASALGMNADFSLTVAERLNVVMLDNDRGYVFRSMQNGAWPAVDTVALGETVTWRLARFDYDEHAIQFVGMPLFTGGGWFPYANPSEVKVTFTQPGTYRYLDPYYGGTGTIVVR